MLNQVPPRPLLPIAEADHLTRWEGTEPLVSILCASYQQVDTVSDALDGFLGQVTSFPFEVVIRDDGSTDGTQDVIAAYASRFPALVRPVFHAVNRWSDQHPLEELLPLARGTFIATCEGDDYWTDPRKLEIQIALLRSRPDAVLSHHDYVFVSDGIVEGSGRRAEKLRDYHKDELLFGAGFRLVSLVFRNIPLPEEPRSMKRIRASADRLLVSRLGLHGGAVYADGVLPAVYRVHTGGVWSGLDVEEQVGADIEESYWTAIFWRRLGNQRAERHYLERARRLIGSEVPSEPRTTGRLRWIHRPRRGR